MLSSGSAFGMDIKTVIYLIRHGECAGNRDNRIRGCIDFELNDNGKAQTEALASVLTGKGIEYMYSSPLMRATVTAEIIGRKIGIGYETCEGFNNIKIGPWEGQLKSELAVKFPKEWETWRNTPDDLRVDGFETIEHVMKRSLAAMMEIIGRHEGRTIAIVTHRGILKPLIAGALGINRPVFWRLHVDNASFSVLTFNRARGFTLMNLNNTEHLKGLPMVQEFE